MKVVLVGAVAAAALLIALRASSTQQPFGQRAVGVAGGRPPVVMLVFDEFPMDTLRGPDGTIDAGRFPNFAALAASSTWFPNAHTIYDSTPKALPAIMDAKRPRIGPPATAAGHPASIFTFFGGRGYRIVASEESTAVCPRRHCPQAAGKRPGVLRNLNGGRPQRLERWIRSIRQTRRPTFYFKDVLLPHGPWIYLPSGRQLRREARDPIPGLNGPAGFHDRGLTLHNEQRYLLQLGFVDRELGKLLARLRQTGLYDRAMIIATADHGFAFEVGVMDRRKVTSANVDEIAPVPLFIKRPGQRRGALNKAYVQTIDIVPTIADVLGAPLRWRADGRSAFSARVRRRRRVRLPTRDFSRVVTLGARSIEARRRANIRRRTQLFGTGRESQLSYGDPMAQLYRIGPHRELLGRKPSTLPAAGGAGRRAVIAAAGVRHSVRPSSRVLPIQVAGSITGARPGSTRNIAVAINGRIEATGRSFHLKGGTAENFSVLVPESSLRPGRNTTDVFEIALGGRALVLLARS